MTRKCSSQNCKQPWTTTPLWFAQCVTLNCSCPSRGLANFTGKNFWSLCCPGNQLANVVSPTENFTFSVLPIIHRRHRCWSQPFLWLGKHVNALSSTTIQLLHCLGQVKGGTSTAWRVAHPTDSHILHLLLQNVRKATLPPPRADEASCVDHHDLLAGGFLSAICRDHLPFSCISSVLRTKSSTPSITFVSPCLWLDGVSQMQVLKSQLVHVNWCQIGHYLKDHPT